MRRIGYFSILFCMIILLFYACLGTINPDVPFEEPEPPEAIEEISCKYEGTYSYIDSL